MPSEMNSFIHWEINNNETGKSVIEHLVFIFDPEMGNKCKDERVIEV